MKKPDFAAQKRAGRRHVGLPVMVGAGGTAAPPHQIDAHDQKGGGHRLIREHSCFQSYYQLNTSSVALLQFAGRIPRGRTQQHRTCQKADAGAQGNEERS